MDLRLADFATGALLAALCLVATRWLGPRIERGLFSAALFGAALVYVVVPFLGGGAEGEVGAVALASAGALLFGWLAWRGRELARFLALGWGIHALWDAGLMLFEISIVPDWYYVACIAFDFAVAGWFALVASGRLRAGAERSA